MRKKKIKKLFFKILLSCTLVLVMMPYILMVANPMRRPEAMATNYVLRLTPIGMDMEEVIRTVRNHRDWNIAWIRYDGGFAHPRPHTLTPIPDKWPYIVGEKSIRVNMGRVGGGYWSTGMPIMGLFMETMVSIFWAFDENGRLTELYVWQSFQ